MPKTQLPHYRLLAMMECLKPGPIPWNYREQVQGWIYNHLDDIGTAIHEAPFSLFSFSLVSPSYRTSAQGIIGSTWLLRISSAHQELLDKLEPKLEHGLILGNTSLRPHLVTRELFCDSERLSSSPIVTMAKETKRYQDPIKQEQEFQAAVATSLANRWKFFTGTPAPEISFRFTDKPVSRKIRYKNRLMTGYEGNVELTTTPELIQFAQCVGLGAKTSCGIGMVV